MKRSTDLLAAVLVVVGGLNWGLVAVAKFDLVAWVFGLDFGQTNAATRVVYGLVGLAAVYEAVRLPSMLASRREGASTAVLERPRPVTERRSAA